MRKILFLFFAFLYFSIFAQNKKFSSEAMMIADEMFINQDYVNAARLYEEIYHEDSVDIKTAVKAGNAYFLAGNTAQAKLFMLEVMEHTQDSFNCYKILSKIYEVEGKIPLAIKSYRYMIGKDSTAIQLKKSLGRIYMNNKLYKDASKIYEKVIKENNQDITSYINFIEATLMLNDTTLKPKIDESITQAIALDSTNINLLKLRVRINYNEEKYHEVIKDIEYINQHMDLNEYYYNILGLSYMHVDSFEKAKLNLQKSFSLKEYREYGHYYIATIEEKQGNRNKALQHYQSAYDESISPYTDVYLKRSGELYLEMDNYDSAISVLEKARILKNTKPEYFYLLAMAYDFKEDAKMAIEYYKSYLKAVSQDGKYSTKTNERIRYLEEYLKLKKLP
jgi:tetratricopeptide (TPR) repeat protein